MRYNVLLDTLQKLIKYKPSQEQLGNILGLAQTTISGRAYRNSNFSDEELLKIESYFNIKLIDDKIDDCITIDHVFLKPSCGKGTAQENEPDIKPVKLGLSLINDVLKISNPNLLKTFTADGDSMSPTIEDGDLLLVDMGRTEYRNGGIFLITINNDWFIKRLRLRITGELDIISDNSKYPIETLTPDTWKEVYIKGRVIKNLSRGL